MPLYDLGCKSCECVTEAFISLADFDKPLSPCACGGERFRKISAPHVVSDIHPYQAMGTDVATGNAPVITSRSQHREYLTRNGYVEVGNEMPKPRPKPTVTKEEVARDVKRTIDHLGVRL